jgi:hypothetical protein
MTNQETKTTTYYRVQSTCKNGGDVFTLEHGNGEPVQNASWVEGTTNLDLVQLWVRESKELAMKNGFVSEKIYLYQDTILEDGDVENSVFPIGEFSFGKKIK